MENIFKQYISEPRYAEYLSINKATTMISKEQAYDDLHMLRYLMGNRYCGWEYYENHVVIWEACFKSIENFISSENEIYISDFCRAIYGAFNVGIVDNHLSFCSPLTGRLSYAKQFAAYFADFKVEQRGELCYAVDSTCAGIADGDVIDAGSCLYPTLSPTSHKRFLVGTRAFTPITEMTVTVNGKPICIPLHRCKAIHKTESHDVCLRHEIKENIDILRSNCCDYVGELSEKTDFVEFGKKFRDKRFLILNYLSNEGGYNRITREFIQGLNDYSHCSEHSIQLISPVTEGKSCERKWILLSEAEPYDYSQATFEGKLIMLVNSDTASSGESAVLYGRSCRNLILIGENTMGCNTFGNVASYELPHSHIVCRIPNVINLCHNPDDCMEGYGFEPDYWVDSEDVTGEVLKWIKNKSITSLEIRKVEKGTELANKLLYFVENFSWEEVKEHTLWMLKNWVFTEWETVFAAMIDDQIVGMASIMKTDYYPLPEIYPWISSVFVTEEYRGRRISEKLIDFANGYAKKSGFGRTYIPSEHVGLYERYGYRYLKDIVNYGNGTDRLHVKEVD